MNILVRKSLSYISQEYFGMTKMNLKWRQKPMLKKILLPLDVSDAGLAARDFAINLGRSFDAQVTGLGILDTPWITAAQPEPLGGTAFKVHRDDVIVEQSHSRVKLLMDDFLTYCQEKNVKASTAEVDGFPATEIERQSQSHDMIVIGSTTDFHFDLDEDTDMTVKHIARDNPRPLFIVPSQSEDSENVLVALNDGFESSRSLHMFILLGLAKGKTLHILCADKYEDVAQNICQRGHQLCQSHGITSHMLPQILTSDPADQVIHAAQNLKASMIVMGGFSHNIFHEAIFGSCTKALMKKCTVPLFIFR
jgi:nucleotide-binding universal stress UspA family protein